MGHLWGTNKGPTCPAGQSVVALFGSLAWWLRVAVKAAWLGGVMASRTHEERERETRVVLLLSVPQWHILKGTPCVLTRSAQHTYGQAGMLGQCTPECNIHMCMCTMGGAACLLSVVLFKH